MKKIKYGFLAVFTMLLLANCTTQTKVPENVKREWMLVEFQDFSKDLMVSSKANLNLTKQNNPGRFSANMGCNNLFGQVIFDQNATVKFSEMGSTMMFCDKSIDLEAAFGKELPLMTNYKVEGHFLTLSNASGMKMKFVAADWD